MGALKQSPVHQATWEKQTPSVTGYNLTGECTGVISALTLLSSPPSFWLPLPEWFPLSEPNPKPEDGTIWVILPGQRRVVSGFEEVTGRVTPCYFRCWSTFVAEVGVSTWLSFGPIPVLKLASGQGKWVSGHFSLCSGRWDPPRNSHRGGFPC